MSKEAANATEALTRLANIEKLLDMLIDREDTIIKLLQGRL